MNNGRNWSGVLWLQAWLLSMLHRIVTLDSLFQVFSSWGRSKEIWEQKPARGCTLTSRRIQLSERLEHAHVKDRWEGRKILRGRYQKLPRNMFRTKQTWFTSSVCQIRCAIQVRSKVLEYSLSEIRSGEPRQACSIEYAWWTFHAILSFICAIRQAICFWKGVRVI